MSDQPRTKVNLPDGGHIYVQTDDPAVAAAAARKYIQKQRTVTPPISTGDGQIETADQAVVAPQSNPGQAAMQATARGLGETLLAPADLLGMGANAVIWAGNRGANALQLMQGKKTHDVAPYVPSFADTAADFASEGAEALGVPTTDPADMTHSDRNLYQALRFGTGALGAAGLMRKLATSRATTDMPRRFDSLVKPYEGTTKEALKTTARDTAGGAGAGLALGEYQHQVGPENTGPLGSLLAMLAGASGGSLTADLPLHGPGVVKQGISRVGRAKDIPYDPDTGLPVSNAIANDASGYMQTSAGTPEDVSQAIRNIIQSGADTADAGAPTLPTGQASGNLGLARVERAVRNTDGGPAVTQRDAEVSQWASDLINRTGGDGDPALFPEESRRIVDTMMEAAQERVDTATAEEEAVRQSRLDAGTATEGFAGRRTKDEASSTAHRLFTDKLQAERTRKNELSDPDYIDPNNRVRLPIDPLREPVERAAKASGDRMSPYDTTPPTVADLRRRLEGDDTVDPPVPPETEIPLRELSESVPKLSRDSRQASIRGAQGDPRAYDQADTLRDVKNTARGQLRDYAGTAGTPEAGRMREALDAQDQFSEKYRREQFEGDTVPEFVRDLENPAKESKTAPTATLPRFMNTRPGSGESTKAFVQRGLQSDDPEAFTSASQNFLVSHAADSVLTDGVLDSRKLGKFIREWEPVIDAVPGARKEFETLKREALSGERNSAGAAKALKEAQGALKMTQDELADSALTLVAGADPQRAVASLFNAKNPAAKVEELVGRLRGVPGGKESLKRAVGDYLFNKVTNTNTQMTSDGALPPSFAKLVNTTMKNDALMTALSKVYDADEMNALNRVRTILDKRNILQAAQGTAGSATASNMQGIMRLMEAGLRLPAPVGMGQLRGGGMAKSIRVGLDLLRPSRDHQVQHLIARAMVDPRVAEALLSRKVLKNPKGWASKVNKVMRWGEFARESGPGSAAEDIKGYFSGEKEDDE